MVCSSSSLPALRCVVWIAVLSGSSPRNIPEYRQRSTWNFSQMLSSSRSLFRTLVTRTRTLPAFGSLALPVPNGASLGLCSTMATFPALGALTSRRDFDPFASICMYCSFVILLHAFPFAPGSLVWDKCPRVRPILACSICGLLSRLGHCAFAQSRRNGRRPLSFLCEWLLVLSIRIELSGISLVWFSVGSRHYLPKFDNPICRHRVFSG